MDLDFSDIFKKYEALAAEVDTVFARVQEQHGDLISCGDGCSDCCHALFDLTLIEALYLNRKFNEAFEGKERSHILDQADIADRSAHQIKRDAFRASREGMSTKEILELVAKSRVRCPLLGEQDKCRLYDFRPLTCRLYGIPTAFGGQAHTCGLSKFEAGKQYPTVHMEKIQDRLMLLSRELIEGLRTRNRTMYDVLVPVSMALMNTYDDTYLGIMSDEEVAEEAKKMEVLRASLVESGMMDEEQGAKPGAVAEKAFAACDSCGEGKGSTACSTCDGTTEWELGKGAK